MNLQKNNNENVISKLARRGFATNWRRNLPALITIAIAVCLVGVFTLIPLGQKQRVKTSIEGRFQASVYRVSTQEAKNLRQALGNENLGLSSVLTNIKHNDYNLLLLYQDANMLSLGKMEWSGALPQKENEIIVSNNFLPRFNAKTGDAVTLNLGFGEQEYIITAAFENNAGESSSNFSIIVSEAFFEKFTENAQAEAEISTYFRLPASDGYSGWQLEEQIYILTESLGIPKDRVFPSAFYINAVNPPSSNTALGAAILAIVILLAAGLVIYSIFYIAIVNNVKDYGRLRLIGTTRRQIRSIVHRQGLFLALIGGTAGIAASAAIAYAVVPDGWRWKNFAASAPVILLAGGIMVYIAVAKPAKIAAGVTPVEAIRYTSADSGGTKQRNRKNKNRKQATPVRLAMLNFARNKKKTTLTLVSLILSGVLMAAASTYFSSISVEKMARGNLLPHGSFFLELDSAGMDNSDSYALSRLQLQNPIDEALLQRIAAMPGVENVQTESSVQAKYIYPGGEITTGQAAGFSPDEAEYLNSLMTTGACNYDSMKNENGIVVMVASTLKEIYGWAPAVGDIVTLQFWTPQGIVSREFTVCATVNDRLKEATFLLPEEVLQEIVPQNNAYMVFIDTDKEKHQELDAALRSLVSEVPSLRMYSIQEIIDAQKSVMELFEILSLVFVIILAVFGIMSLVNLIISSTLVRRQELAMMQAVGLTGRQLTQMVLFEGLVYSLSTVFATFTVGSVAGAALCAVVNSLSANQYLEYSFPLVPVAIFSAALLVVQAAVSFYSIRLYNKDTLIVKLGQNS